MLDEKAALKSQVEELREEVEYYRALEAIERENLNRLKASVHSALTKHFNGVADGVTDEVTVKVTHRSLQKRSSALSTMDVSLLSRLPSDGSKKAEAVSMHSRSGKSKGMSTTGRTLGIQSPKNKKTPQPIRVSHLRLSIPLAARSGSFMIGSPPSPKLADRKITGILADRLSSLDQLER